MQIKDPKNCFQRNFDEHFANVKLCNINYFVNKKAFFIIITKQGKYCNLLLD